MTVFDKARELGALICNTEEAAIRSEAMEKFQQDAEAVEIMKNYEEFQRKIEIEMQNGTMTQEQFVEATEKLRKLGSQVKANPTTGAYVQSANNFNKLINQVFHIIHSTAWGEMESTFGGSCGNGCGCGERGSNGGCSCGCGSN